jgi:hypothetical protein
MKRLAIASTLAQACTPAEDGGRNKGGERKLSDDGSQTVRQMRCQLQRDDYVHHCIRTSGNE